MRGFVCMLMAFVFAVVGMAACPVVAEAHGGVAIRQRQVIRQRVVQPVVRQRVVVQQVVQPVAVQAVYAAPVVQSYVAPQAVVVPQAFYSAPLIQSYSSGCGVSQSLRLRSSVGGCGAFFGH